MASKCVKLSELKVVDLKRELEERDLDTSGTKSVLQQRLLNALVEAGEDPETVLFETMFGSADFNKTIKCLLDESNKNLENKLDKLDENNKNLENKLNESNKNLENKLDESNKNLENKLQEYSSKLDSKVCSLESNFEKLEEKVSLIENKLEDQINVIESKLEDKLVSRLRLRIDAQDNSMPASSVDSPHRPDNRQCEVSEPEAKPAGAVLSMPSANAIPAFDGKTPWEDYMTLFETAAMVHGWPQETKASMLCLSLRGDALGVLQTMPLSERRNYPELIRRLEMRFGHRHMDQLYRSQLRNRIQKPNESLQEFEADIARLVRNAYPSVTDDVYESLAVDKFLDGLREPETQQAVKLARPKTLSDALTQALEFEAVRQSVRGQARVRSAEAEPTTPLDIENIVKQVLEALRTRKKEVRCWNCGQLGHPRSKCKVKSADKKQEN